MNDELYPKEKQTTIGSLICDMANCLDHVRAIAIQLLARCPEDEDSIKKIYDLMAEASQICRGVYIDQIKLKTEDREDFLNGNSK